MKEAAHRTTFSSKDKSLLLRLPLTSRTVQRRLLCADDWIVLRFLVYLKPVHILLRYRHVGEDGLDRAFRQTRVAVNASIGVDQKLVGQFMERLDRADSSAVGVFTFNARLSNYIGHIFRRPPRATIGSYKSPALAALQTKACSRR